MVVDGGGDDDGVCSVVGGGGVGLRIYLFVPDISLQNSSPPPFSKAFLTYPKVCPPFSPPNDDDDLGVVVSVRFRSMQPAPISVSSVYCIRHKHSAVAMRELKQKSGRLVMLLLLLQYSARLGPKTRHGPSLSL